MALGYLGKTLVAASLGAMAFGNPLPAAQTPEPVPLEQTVAKECDGCGPVGVMEIPVPSQTVGMATYVHRAADGSIISKSKIGIKPSKTTAAIKGSVRETTVDHLDEGDTANLIISPGESVEIWGPWATHKRSGTLRTDLPKNRNEDELVRRIGAVDQFSRDGRQYAQITYDELQDNDLTAVNLTYNAKLYKVGERGENGEDWCASSAFDVMVSRVAEDSVREVTTEIHHHHYQAATPETPGQEDKGKCSDGRDNDGDDLVDFRQPGDISFTLDGNTYWGRDENGNGFLDRNDRFRDPGCHGPKDGEKGNRGKTRKLKRWLRGGNIQVEEIIRTTAKRQREPGPRTEVRLIGGISNDQYTSEQPRLGVRDDETFDLSFAGINAKRLTENTKIEGTVLVHQGTEAVDDYYSLERGENALGFAGSFDYKYFGPLTVGIGAEYLDHSTYVGARGFNPVKTSDQSNLIPEISPIGLTFGDFNDDKWLKLQLFASFQSIVEDYAGLEGRSDYDFTPNVRLEAYAESDEGWFFELEGRYGESQTIYNNTADRLVEGNSSFHSAEIGFGKRFRNGFTIGVQFKNSLNRDSFIPDATSGFEQTFADSLYRDLTHSNNRAGIYVGKSWK